MTTENDDFVPKLTDSTLLGILLYPGHSLYDNPGDHPSKANTMRAVNKPHLKKMVSKEWIAWAKGIILDVDLIPKEGDSNFGLDSLPHQKTSALYLCSIIHLSDLLCVHLGWSSPVYWNVEEIGKKYEISTLCGGRKSGHFFTGVAIEYATKVGWLNRDSDMNNPGFNLTKDGEKAVEYLWRNGRKIQPEIRIERTSIWLKLTAIGALGGTVLGVIALIINLFAKGCES